ncbi:MAG: DPP IV N-terminal domain-containing protein [candidate division Zixibacteria bacterium]|nr:DPP IV N-terminal domain-containing protein [candidate division Zixibacteria bacterium]
MKKSILALLIVSIVCPSFLSAQEVRFGKNKVRYKQFDWSYLQTRHFDMHFYEDAYPAAKFAAAVMESSYVEISGELNYLVQRRIPVFIYNSHNDFQQTNIISSLISEGTGGFTEMFKNRIVIPFSGSYEDFRHVLHHELTHAVTFDMLYGNALSSLISRQRFFSMPLWLAEGYAEYSSRHGWDYWSDMVVRDACVNGYLAPPWALGGYLAYKEGQAMIKYIADKYGEEKLGEIFRNGKIHLTMNRTLKETIGIDEEKFWQEFSKEMKRRYWPEIAIRKDPDEISKQLTHARKDGSYFNEKPAFSPEGDRIAIFTDKSDYTEIVLISAADGKVVDRLVEAQRSGDLESLHSYVSGMSWSPDGRQIAFAAKSGGKESIFLYDLSQGKVTHKKRTGYHNIISPAWSPDGKKIAFSALEGYKRDLFLYDLESDQVKRLTNDRYDDVEASWLPEGNQLIFCSDRPHQQSPTIDLEKHLYVDSGAFMPGDFEYGYYNLFRIDLLDLTISELGVGPGQNKAPAVSPDGSKVAYISNRNGIDNLYVALLDSTQQFAVTDIISGVKSLSWSPDSKQIAFSAFFQGAFDIFILKDLIPAGEGGVLSPTDFILGKYDLLKPHRGNKTLVTRHNTNDTSSQSEDAIDWDNDYQTYTPDSTTWTQHDSSLVDSNLDTSTAEVDTTADGSTVTETGIHDGEYVYVAPADIDPLDSVMININDTTGRFTVGLTEPALFDSVPPPLASGDYTIRKYKTKFTPDYIGGGFAYDTFFGLRGQTQFVFSDYLGNHQIQIATDLVNTIDQSYIQAFYFYNRHRTNVGAGFFHSKNYYIDNTDFLFSDRFYGLTAFAGRPFSTFSRLQFVVSQYFIDREYHDRYDYREDRSTKVTTGEFAYVTDNIIWGLTGPLNGRRAKLSIQGGINLFDSRDIDFQSVELDYRKYRHLGKTFSMAFRLAGGASFGRTPKQYFLGGTTNWIGNRTLDANVYDVENLYFADVVTPLRGVPYYELAGNRFVLANFEFRFPMIEYFVMRFPLSLVIANVGGAIFADLGAAWTDNNFKFGTRHDGNRLVDMKSGFGFGMRANMGFILLRYDLAWSTDFQNVSDKPTYYFSFGADF